MMFKKTPALFAIWILLVATFGPIGLVSAGAGEIHWETDGVLACRACGVGKVSDLLNLGCDETMCNSISSNRISAGFSGCVYDRKGINGCFMDSTEIRACGSCGTTTLDMCGVAECEQIIGVAREDVGLPGCEYYTGKGDITKVKNKCVPKDDTINTGGVADTDTVKCFGSDRSTCVVCSISEGINERYYGIKSSESGKRSVTVGDECDLLDAVGPFTTTLCGLNEDGNTAVLRCKSGKFEIDPTGSDCSSTGCTQVGRYNAVCSHSDEPEVKCQVINFELPQKTRDWENAILAYGDPDYITYWQNFPAGEEGSWESLVLWHENIGLLVLTAFPVGKVFGKGIKAVSKSAEAFETAVTSSKSNLGSKFINGVNKVLNRGVAGETKGVAAVSERVSSKEGAIIAKKLLDASDDNLFNVLSKKTFGKSAARLMPKEADNILGQILKLKSGGDVKWKIIAGTLATGGAISVEGLTVSGWFLDRTLSIAAKFEQQPNNMVLKLPFFPVQNLGLGDAARYMMVVLDKPKMFDTTAYLASPCKANFEVEMDTCYCEADTYMYIEGNMMMDSEGKSLKLYDDEGNIMPSIIDDDPETENFDESTELDGVVRCKLVTPGHEIKEIATGTFGGGLKVLWGASGAKALKDLITEGSVSDAKEKYYSDLSTTSETLYDLYNENQIVKVPCVKIKDTWHDDSDTNFCYASATGVGTAVLVGSLAVDAVLMIGTYGTATEVAVGIGVAAVSYYATHSTAWPKHNFAFWNS